MAFKIAIDRELSRNSCLSHSNSQMEFIAEPNQLRAQAKKEHGEESIEYRVGRAERSHKAALKQTKTRLGHTHRVGVGAAAEMIHDSMYAARRRNAKRKDLSAPAQRWPRGQSRAG